MLGQIIVSILTWLDGDVIDVFLKDCFIKIGVSMIVHPTAQKPFDGHYSSTCGGTRNV